MTAPDQTSPAPAAAAEPAAQPTAESVAAPVAAPAAIPLRRGPQGRGPRQVAIAGAGLGGLACAIAMAKIGAEVTVLERAPAPAEVGAGIQLSPNAVKALRWLGVDLSPARPWAPDAIRLRRGRSGAQVYRLPLGEAAERRWGAPYLQVHRADMHAALAQAALNAGVSLRFGRDVTGYALAEAGPGAHLLSRPAASGISSPPADPAATGERRKNQRAPSLKPGALAAAPLPEPEAEPAADLVIGADGVRSGLRAQMLPPQLGVVFSGDVAYRGLVPAAALPAGIAPRGADVWMGPGAHAVAYPVRDGALINVVAVVENRGVTPESWSRPADPAALAAAFADWHPDLRALIGAIEAPFEWGLFGHPPLPFWSQGPVVLVGDAAHPTTPHLAQGAAMAFEDAVTLARVLPAYGIEYGLAAFRKLRFTRCTRLQQAAARNGRRFHARSALDGAAKAAAIGALGLFAPGVARGLNDWVYAHDPATAPV